MQVKDESFTFFVVAYNHENYIVEHLESIKYLIVNYASSIDVDIVVNDDCSRDKTVDILELWLNINKSIFRNIVFLKNIKNIGTCASIINMLGHLKTDFAKITAGDDVYSYENIFEIAFDLKDDAIISGISLDLTDGVISKKKVEFFNTLSTKVIYQNKPLSYRFKHLSINNAPNIIYSMECLKSVKLQSLLGQYDVVEDWPIQIAIAKYYPSKKFKLVNKTLVYYRRTIGSTYIVASKRFSDDKIRMYDYLIQCENNFFELIRLKSRKWCFSASNRFVNKFMNLDFYFYVSSVFFNLYKISKEIESIDLNVEQHVIHYKLIQERSKVFLHNTYVQQ